MPVETPLANAIKPLQKSKFMKASDRIRQEVEKAIKDALLLPGDAIDEAELASQHGVSRTPVREALIQLQAQGLVTSLPRGGMVVAKMDLQQLLSLWELLAELEGVAARLACQRMTPEELAAIVSLHDQSLQAAERDDVAAWQESNLRFHELIYRATRNPFLRQEVLRMRTRTGFYRQHAFAALGKIKASYEQHQLVVFSDEIYDQIAYIIAQGWSPLVEHVHPSRSMASVKMLLLTLPLM
jgi:DNA-binding GntR family transcriptional regulator